MSNVKVFATQDGRPAGCTNTAHYIDLYVTHVEQKQNALQETGTLTRMNMAGSCQLTYHSLSLHNGCQSQSGFQAENHIHVWWQIGRWTAGWWLCCCYIFTVIILEDLFENIHSFAPFSSCPVLAGCWVTSRHSVSYLTLPPIHLWMVMYHCFFFGIMYFCNIQITVCFTL